MFRLRLVFAFSLVILVGVFIAIVYFMPSGQSYTESKRAQIIQGENEWILQYDIINNEERDIKYTIQVTVEGVVYSDTTLVKQGGAYTYIYHIYPSQLKEGTEGKVTFAVHKESEAKPIEQATYYIKLD